MAIQLGERKERIGEITLSAIELLAAIAAIVLASIALGIATESKPCQMEDLDDLDEGDTKDNSTICAPFAADKQICCGVDDAAVLINAGVVQLASVIFLVLVFRLGLQAWRYREERFPMRATTVQMQGTKTP
ncbi:Transmembrane protein [Balamuthia mandrillaris]